MADQPLAFHVPQEAEPSSVVALLEVVQAEQATFPTVSALLAFARQRGVRSRSELSGFARDCGLLERTEDGAVALSEIAREVLRLRPEVRPDVIHYLIYTGWDDRRPLEKTTLWSYRQVADLMWQQPGTHAVKIARVIAEEVRNQIHEVFGADASFSTKSVRGVRKWMEGLTPQAIVEDMVVRRGYCPPELALMALGWVATSTHGDLELDLLLTPERREALCRVCLLQPSALDRLLDWTIPLYPEVLRPGTGAGVYGRFIRFLKWPELHDLPR